MSDNNTRFARRAQTPYKELAIHSLTASRDHCKDRDPSMPLLDLPDGILEEIGAHLPPACMCLLQSTCKHLRTVLQQERLWQEQLKSYDSVWAASGVCPVPNRYGSQSWKELVATSVRLQPAGIGGDVLASPQAVCRKGLCLWNSDKDPEELHVQLDYHLCHTEHKSSTWRQALGEHHFRAENIADLIEFIYFLWFEARQLSRAAHMLAKVLALLRQDRASADPAEPELCMGYSTTNKAIYAACVGSYLVDLLHMTCLNRSPMSVQHPDTFLRACQDDDCLDGAASTPDEDHFEWCGGSYSHKDLAEAVAVLQNASCQLDQSTSLTSSHDHEDSSQSAVDELSEQWDHNLLGHYHSQHIGKDYESHPMHPVFSWPPDAWGILGREARTLLTGLLCADHIPWAYLQYWGSALKRKVQGICSGPRGRCLAPSDACRGFTIYAANTLLHCLHSGPQSTTVYAQTGRLFDSAKQYRRAAHYYKLHIMANCGSAYLPGEHGEAAALICLAGAYDWDSVETGALHSCKQAFAWQRALVRCLVGLADQLAELSKQCRVLADMLVSTSSTRFAPHLHLNTRLVLAVGGYQTSLKSTDDGPALLAWLQGRLEVLKMTEQAFLVFLDDEQEAFHTITEHAARRRALKDQPSSTTELQRPTGGHLPSTDFHAAHVDIINQMGLAMSQLPAGGGDAGRCLSAIAALLGNEVLQDAQ